LLDFQKGEEFEPNLEVEEAGGGKENSRQVQVNF
jgi:hypothetical protein